METESDQWVYCNDDTIMNQLKDQELGVKYVRQKLYYTNMQLGEAYSDSQLLCEMETDVPYYFSSDDIARVMAGGEHTETMDGNFYSNATWKNIDTIMTMTPPVIFLHVNAGNMNTSDDGNHWVLLYDTNQINGCEQYLSEINGTSETNLKNQKSYMMSMSQDPTITHQLPPNYNIYYPRFQGDCGPDAVRVALLLYCCYIDNIGNIDRFHAHTHMLSAASNAAGVSSAGITFNNSGSPVHVKRGASTGQTSAEYMDKLDDDDILFSQIVKDDVKISDETRETVFSSPQNQHLVQEARTRVLEVEKGNSVFAMQLVGKLKTKYSSLSDDEIMKKARKTIRPVFAAYKSELGQMKLVYPSPLVNEWQTYHGPCGLTGVRGRPMLSSGNAHIEHSDPGVSFWPKFGYTLLFNDGYDWDPSLYSEIRNFYDCINAHNIQVLGGPGKGVYDVIYEDENEKYQDIVKRFNALYNRNQQLRSDQPDTKFPPELILATMLEFCLAWSLPNEIKSNAPFSHDGRPDNVRGSGDYTWVFANLIDRWVHEINEFMTEAYQKDGKNDIDGTRLIDLLKNKKFKSKKIFLKDGKLSIDRENSVTLKGLQKKGDTKDINTETYFAVIEVIPAISEAIAMKGYFDSVGLGDRSVLVQSLYTNICFRHKLMDRIRNRINCHPVLATETIWEKIVKHAITPPGNLNDNQTLALSKVDIQDGAIRGLKRMNNNYTELKMHFDETDGTEHMSNPYDIAVKRNKEAITNTTNKIASIQTILENKNNELEGCQSTTGRLQRTTSSASKMQQEIACVIYKLQQELDSLTKMKTELETKLRDNQEEEKYLKYPVPDFNKEDLDKLINDDNKYIEDTNDAHMKVDYTVFNDSPHTQPNFDSSEDSEPTLSRQGSNSSSGKRSANEAELQSLELVTSVAPLPEGDGSNNNPTSNLFMSGVKGFGNLLGVRTRGASKKLRKNGGTRRKRRQPKSKRTRRVSKSKRKSKRTRRVRKPSRRSKTRRRVK